MLDLSLTNVSNNNGIDVNGAIMYLEDVRDRFGKMGQEMRDTQYYPQSSERTT